MIFSLKYFGMNLLEKLGGKKEEKPKSVAIEDLGSQEVATVEARSNQPKPKGNRNSDEPKQPGRVAAFRVLDGPTAWGSREEVQGWVDANGGPDRYVIRDFPV